MNYYQEITLLNDENISFFDLWSKLYKQLHIALADIKNNHAIDTIGVCFPQYHFMEKEDKIFSKLGSQLRVFSPSKSELEKLNLVHWLSYLSDYLHIKSINTVGDKTKSYVCVSRYQYKNKLKQAKAFAKYKNIDIKQALILCNEHKRPNKNYPFIRLNSETSQNTYTLAIKQEIVDNNEIGSFNTYGINNASGKVTLPFW